MDSQDNFDLIVNAEAKTVVGREVTFLEVVRLAFPHKVDEPNITFVVTYRRADKPTAEGSMVEGDTVEIKKNGATSFTVVHATKS